MRRTGVSGTMVRASLVAAETQRATWCPCNRSGLTDPQRFRFVISAISATTTKALLCQRTGAGVSSTGERDSLDQAPDTDSWLHDKRCQVEASGHVIGQPRAATDDYECAVVEYASETQSPLCQRPARRSPSRNQ